MNVWDVVSIIVLAAQPCLCVHRTYYIAAVEELWDYAPLGRDAMMGAPFANDTNRSGSACAQMHMGMAMSAHHSSSMWVQATSSRIGRRYWKAIYREFTGKDFTTRKAQSEGDSHLGILGPVIRAEVGDVITVHYWNNVSFQTSIHAHGVQYSKQNEGAPYEDGEENNDSDIVEPGQQYTYTWQVPEESGPTDRQDSSVAWLYHSHVNEPRETNAGLLGVIVVTRRGEALHAQPRDVDYEVVLSYFIFDESSSSLYDKNVQTFLNASGTLTTECLSMLESSEMYKESNMMYSINGYVYGNLPDPIMHINDRVRWYVFGFGNFKDVHTPHWHGNTLIHEGLRKDVLQVLPSYITSADMIPYNQGQWMLQCHVHHHIHGGMYARYTVKDPIRSHPSERQEAQHPTASAGDATPSRYNGGGAGTPVLGVLLLVGGVCSAAYMGLRWYRINSSVARSEA